MAKTKYTDEDRKKIVKERGYELLEISREKQKNRTFIFITVRCSLGHISKMKWDNFQQNKDCKYCANNVTFTYEYVKEYIESFGYKLLSTEYEVSTKPLKLQCPNEHEFEMSFEKFYNAGHRCTKCSESKGEREITRILNKYNIENVSQCRFEGCKFKQQLPFDFYLPKYNILIEYDGEQHYKMFDYFGGFDKFVNTKIRDTIKNEYCKKNNIKLIRIPYWEYENIEKILKCELEL